MNNLYTPFENLRMNMATEQIPLWIYIIVSAATGAVSSALIGLFGQWRERKWKRKELILKTAADLAVEHTNKVFRIAEGSGQTALIYDHVHVTADYYKELNHLIDKNSLTIENIEKIRIKERKMGLHND